MASKLPARCGLCRSLAHQGSYHVRCSNVDCVLWEIACEDVEHWNSLQAAITRTSRPLSAGEHEQVLVLRRGLTKDKKLRRTLHRMALHQSRLRQIAQAELAKLRARQKPEPRGKVLARGKWYKKMRVFISSGGQELLPMSVTGKKIPAEVRTVGAPKGRAGK